ncbi:MAG TPA: DUF488 domain-containing protein [Chitinophagaceae bacterium]|nr:DUF488 domain-containing protein [Chitinophagaceae bacterium]
MAAAVESKIWTIGHSTHDIDVLIEMLKAFKIEIVLDVRRFPSSRKFPHFNKETFRNALQDQNIGYLHLEGIGGRRKIIVKSKNVAWRNPSFRAYADHMETAEFKESFEELKNIARKQSAAILCSEAVWWRCPRSLLSDLLKINGWKVIHIMNAKKETEHPYTQAAQILEGELRYDLNIYDLNIEET